MSYRAIAASPGVLLALGLAAYAVTPEGSRDAVLHSEVYASKILAFAGLCAAALAFERGDYLRRAWGLSALCYAFLFARDLGDLLSGQISASAVDVIHGVLLTLGNACLVGSVWMLGRAWSVAGLEHPGSLLARRTAIGLAILASLICAGPMLWVDIRDLSHGTLPDFELVASDLGDILSLPLIAPVALTALAVQGGALRWTWTLLASSLMAWLLYDAVYTVQDYFPLVSPSVRTGSEVFHVLAGLFALASGLAQRRAVTGD